MPPNPGRNFPSEFGFDQPYWTINREERNYAALLYHVLLCNDNLERFLADIDYKGVVIPDQVAIYVEYAFLRDMWNDEALGNEQKRQAITHLLGTRDVRALTEASTLEWNTHFGATPRPSTKHIQNPGRWSLDKFDQHIANDQEFRETCKFKWSFNIKPDLVIQTASDQAVVIEAKYESGESFYPTSETARRVWERRHLDPVGQTHLQQFMFYDLLGIDSTHLYVVKNPHAMPSHAGARTLTWGQAFGGLDLTGLPPFAAAWLKQLAD